MMDTTEFTLSKRFPQHQQCHRCSLRLPTGCQKSASVVQVRPGTPVRNNAWRNGTVGAGFTLVELMVAVGLFAIVMLLSSGAYLMMIALNQQAQNITSGIDNLSFALETMTRTIRTGSNYSCGALGGDCPSGGSSLTFTDGKGNTVTYALSGSSLLQTSGGVQSLLTDSSVTITSLTFYVFGSKNSDYEQAHVSVSVSGTVSAGQGKPPKSFTIETGATMRGTDLAGSAVVPPSAGQQAFTTPGTFSWVAPSNVTSVSVVCVGSGGNGQSSGNGFGGGGGALAYANTVTVTPGNSYAVVVAAGGDRAASSFNGTTVRAESGGNNGAPGVVLNGTGFPGGSGQVGPWSGGGGAGGYSGPGGDGGYTFGTAPTAGTGGGGSGGGSDFTNNGGGGGGGGVGLLGQGADGVPQPGPWGTSFGYASGSGGGGSGGADGVAGQMSSSGGAGGAGGSYGGGGGAGMYDQSTKLFSPGGAGANGACRIIWPGTIRQFPSTNTANM